MRKAIQNKIKKIEELKEKIKKYKVVGIIDLRDLPSKQFQQIKRTLRDVVEIVVVKKIIIEKTLNELAKDVKNIDSLIKYLEGSVPALLLSNIEPFKLMINIQRNRSPAHAKAGQIAPNDITIRAGPTPFTPGPVLSEFGKIGVKAKIVQGKVVVVFDAVVVKEGEKVSKDVANMLLKLGLEPMKVGLNLVAVYEKGEIYEKEQLFFDEDKFRSDLAMAYSQAITLAVSSNIITKETMSQLFSKAEAHASILKKVGEQK